jgi:hypothetical protein
MFVVKCRYSLAYRLACVNGVLKWQEKKEVTAIKSFALPLQLAGAVSGFAHPVK